MAGQTFLSALLVFSMSKASPLNLVFAGAGEFGVPTLKALLDAGHHVMRVYSQPDRPAGRGRKLTSTPVTQFALEQNLDLVRTEDLNNEPLPPADLLIVIAFGQKISEAIANHARLGSVNLHASRLPKYRGAAPINWAILNGETQTGNSVIRLAQRMDAGAVLGMSRVVIGELETAGHLHDRLAMDGATLMLDVIDRLVRGVATETPQDESAATKAPKLTREASRIEWNKPGDALARQIRGMYPWPGCRAALLDSSGTTVDRLTLVRGRARTAGGKPGTILDGGEIACGDNGAIDLIELQPEGKRPMPLADYRNGHRWEVGMRLEPLA
jgi:methionyl-tRNA formyltransferase